MNLKFVRDFSLSRKWEGRSPSFSDYVYPPTGVHPVQRPYNKHVPDDPDK
jgi:hypothetical protein